MSVCDNHIGAGIHHHARGDEFGLHTARSKGRAASAGAGKYLGRKLTRFGYDRCRGIEMRICGVKSVDVGKKYEQFCVQMSRDNRGKSVVISDFYFIR